MKTLILEKRGCNFENDPVMDVNNHRVCGTITDKKGRQLFIEFTHGACYRFNNKRTGKPLKKPILEHWNKLWINTQYDDTYTFSDGSSAKLSFRDSKIESEISKKNYLYTRENILNVVNAISKDHYDSVAFK